MVKQGVVAEGVKESTGLTASIVTTVWLVQAVPDMLDVRSATQMVHTVAQCPFTVVTQMQEKAALAVVRIMKMKRKKTLM